METAYDMAAALARYLFIVIILYVIIASAVLSIKEARTNFSILLLALYP